MDFVSEDPVDLILCLMWSVILVLLALNLTFL